MRPEERWIERDRLAKLLDTGLQITSFGKKLLRKGVSTVKLRAGGPVIRLVLRRKK